LKTLQKAIAIVSFPFYHLVSNPSKVINIFGNCNVNRHR
jgi:hypothetical protein